MWNSFCSSANAIVWMFWFLVLFSMQCHWCPRPIPCKLPIGQVLFWGCLHATDKSTMWMLKVRNVHNWTPFIWIACKFSFQMNVKSTSQIPVYQMARAFIVRDLPCIALSQMGRGREWGSLRKVYYPVSSKHRKNCECCPLSLLIVKMVEIVKIVKIVKLFKNFEIVKIVQIFNLSKFS